MFGFVIDADYDTLKWPVAIRSCSLDSSSRCHVSLVATSIGLVWTVSRVTYIKMSERVFDKVPSPPVVKSFDRLYNLEILLRKRKWQKTTIHLRFSKSSFIFQWLQFIFPVCFSMVLLLVVHVFSVCAFFQSFRCLLFLSCSRSWHLTWTNSKAGIGHAFHQRFGWFITAAMQCAPNSH